MDNSLTAFTDDNFEAEVLKSEVPVFVDFWAEWCGPCRMLTPTIVELAGEYRGKVKFGKVNVDHNQQTAIRYGIRSIPALLVFKDGKVAAQQVGAQPKASLVRMLDGVLS